MRAPHYAVAFIGLLLTMAPLGAQTVRLDSCLLKADIPHAKNAEFLLQWETELVWERGEHGGAGVELPFGIKMSDSRVCTWRARAVSTRTISLVGPGDTLWLRKEAIPTRLSVDLGSGRSLGGCDSAQGESKAALSSYLEQVRNSVPSWARGDMVKAQQEIKELCGAGTEVTVSQRQKCTVQ
jgi:hypothetical protein